MTLRMVAREGERRSNQPQPPLWFLPVAVLLHLVALLALLTTPLF